MKDRALGGSILVLMAVSVAAAITVTAGPAQAVSSNGPYYAEPAWDQKLPASTRFVVLLDWNSEAVLDRETGLVWEQSPSALFEAWDVAASVCLNSTKGGRKGWRLPSVSELASLVDPSVPPPGVTFPAGSPFVNIQFDTLNNYWSGTIWASDTTRSYYVRFRDGFVGVNFKSTSNLAWCVRGGMNAGQY